MTEVISNVTTAAKAGKEFVGVLNNANDKVIDFLKFVSVLYFGYKIAELIVKK